MCRLQKAGARAAGLTATSLLRTISYFPDHDQAAAAPDQGPATSSPRALSHAHTTVDYEYGKAYDKQDAERYFGGMRGVYLYGQPSLALYSCFHSPFDMSLELSDRH